MGRSMGLRATSAARRGGHGGGLFENRLGLLVLFVLRAGFLGTRSRGGVAAIAAAASAASTGTAAAAFGGGAFALLLFSLFSMSFGAGGAELLGASVAFRILVVVLLLVFVILVETRLAERGLVEAWRVEIGLLGRLLGEGGGRQG
ncbi:MAG TPA: hypothetical protein VGS07_27235 [Thermoanaerobaculia bacterium]|nr:hypothetical protein [Thermoanaerobaculia bacterium]